MRLPEFEYLEPRSVAEACSLLAEDPEGSVPFAGGTDVLVDLKLSAARYRRLVSLQRIDGLDEIRYSDADGLSIGAMATANRVIRDEQVRRHYPGIVEAAGCIAAVQVRNQATIAGNLCAAVPSADMAPILLVLGAKLRVASPDGERVIPVDGFFTGPRETVLQPADVVTAVEMPAPAPRSGDANLRQGGRVALSLAMACAAARVVLEGEICREAQVALGAVAPTPILVPGAGEAVIGKPLGDDTLAEAGRRAADAARPIDDVRASREYRLDLVQVLVRRALERAARRAGENG